MSKMEIEPQEPAQPAKAAAAAAQDAGKGSAASSATWAQLAKGSKQPAPAAGQSDDDSSKAAPAAEEPSEILANGKHDDDALAASDAPEASEPAALPTPDPTPSSSPTPALPAPLPAVNVWKVRMQQQQQQNPAAPGSPAAGSSPRAGRRSDGDGEASVQNSQWPDLADAGTPPPSSSSESANALQNGAPKSPANGSASKDAAAKKKQWTPLEVDIKYKDAPTKVKKPSSAHPPSTRQRPESTPNSTHDDRVESPAPGSGIDVGTPGSTSSGTGRTSTITEHHQVGVHEVTIKKVVFPASSDAPKGSTISAHGKISTDASSDAEKQGDDGKAGSEAAGEATESSGTGYFHRGGPTYRGGNFPPPPPTNTRGRSFGQNAVALAAAAAAQANNRSNAGFPIVRRGQNYQSGGQEGNKPGSGSLQPPQQGKESRRATSLPPRPATGGATAPPNAATQTKPSSGSVQSMTPGRRTSGNPGGFGGRFYGNASGSAPSSPPGGSGGNMQYYGGSGYNNYYYGQYGYGYNYYGQGDAAGSSMTYLADPSWYPTSSLTVPVVLGFLKAQVEWYFSVDNLVKDLFLRRQMDESGWIEAKVIGGFRRIVGWRDHLATLEGKERGDEEWLVDKLVESVEGTEVLEVVARSADGPAKFRKKEDWSIWLLPKQNDSSPSAVSAKVESSVSPATQSVADSEAKADNKPAEVAEPIATGAEQQSSNESISAETSTPVPTEDPVAVVNVEEAEAQVLVEEVAFVAQDGQATIAQGAREEPARIVEELLQDAAIEDGKGLVDHDQSDSAERIKDGQSPTMDKPAEVAAAAAEPAPTSGPAAKSSWAAAVGGKTVAAEVAAAVATTATEAELPKVSRVASWADEPERQRAPAAAAVTTSDASASPRDTEGGNEEPAQQDEDEGWTTVNTKKTKKVEKPSSSAFRGKRSNGNGGKRGTGNRTSGSAQREGGSGEDEEKSDWRKRNGSRNKQQRSPRPSPSEATAVTSEPNGEAQES